MMLKILNVRYTEWPFNCPLVQLSSKFQSPAHHTGHLIPALKRVNEKMCEGSVCTYVCILCVQIVGTVRRQDVGLVFRHCLGAFQGGTLWRFRCYAAILCASDAQIL